MTLLVGKKVASEIENEIREKIELLDTDRRPCLVVFLVGNHAPSLAYVSRKKIACESVGMISEVQTLPESISKEDLISKIREKSQDPKVDGILVQAPLPPHLSFASIVEAIDPKKDVDGFHPLNMGKLMLGLEGGFIPCTPLGIQVLLSRSNIEIEGKHVVIIGRSNIVGRPLAALLSQNRKGCNATVTIAHSKTERLIELTRSADIIVAACGKPRFVTAEMVQEGSVVIDVGISRIGNRLVGDVDFDSVQSKCKAITPVPNGVGPMTVACLLHNTLLSFERSL